MTDSLYPLFSIFSFIGFFITLIPLPWHLEAWNSGTCFYMIWTSLACLNQFINSIVWRSNAINWAPVWCDISIRIILGASVAIPAASLCIVRRLYHIASVQSVILTRADKRRAILIDSLICVLFPLMFIGLQYVVQGHRFDIFEDIGCYPAIYATLLTFFTSKIWPTILGLISAVYCVLSIIAFSRHRSHINGFLSSSKLPTISRYHRLMALAMTEILFTTPLAIYSMYQLVSQGLEPWISWSNVHYNFSHVDQVPALYWTQSRMAVVALQMSRWSPVACAFVFFAFFGFAEEARKNYRAAFRAVLRTLGCCSVAKASSASRSTRALGNASEFSRRTSSGPRSIHAESIASSSSESTSPSSYDEKQPPLDPITYISTLSDATSPQSSDGQPQDVHDFARPPLPPVPAARRFTC